MPGAATVAADLVMVDESKLHRHLGTSTLNGANGASYPRSPSHPERVIILGGGVAGLASGLELARRGWDVTILEKGNDVGGLARTIRHDAFRFDIGGHRFHSHNSQLLYWLRELLGDDLLRVSRRSHIYLQGRYVSYPLQFPEAMGIFGPRELWHVLLSYASARFQMRHAAHEATSFEEWVVQRFGRALFEIYFRPYTEKVWGMPCSELSADWAAQRISLPDLATTIRRALYPGRRPPPTIVNEFFYPRYGFGMIPARMAEELRRTGGRVLTGAAVRAVQPVNGGYAVSYEAHGLMERLSAERIVSTIPLNVLLQALPEADDAPREVQLEYRDLICVFLAINRQRVSRDHWTYFPQRELIFGRTHEPVNWSAALTPPGMTSLVAEIYTGRDEATWQANDEILASKTVLQLETLGLLPPGSVVDRRVLRVKNAYPIYLRGYAEQLQRTRRYLHHFPNLHLVGRTGAFRYLNSDGVIEDALDLVDWLSGLAPVRSNAAEYAVVP